MCQHLSIARVAEGLGVAWNTANDAVLAEGRGVLINDPGRLNGVKSLGSMSRCGAPGRQPMRVESEYRRHGTLAYLAAYDVHRAHVIGHCAKTTGIAPFTELVEKVMTSKPYATARPVFWIVDNGSSHRGWTAAARLSDAFPNARMIHLPVHASWLNQVVRHEVARVQ